MGKHYCAEEALLKGTHNLKTTDTDWIFSACHGGIDLNLENGLPAKLHFLSSLKNVARLYFRKPVASEYFALEVNLNGDVIYIVFYFLHFDWLLNTLKTSVQKTYGQVLFIAYNGQAYNHFTRSAQMIFDAIRLKQNPHITALLQNDKKIQ